MVGISNDRMQHILSVARQCYQIAKNKYHLEETDCKKAFMIGFLHDVGYEFSEYNLEHPEKGMLLVKETLGIELPEILLHGDPDAEQTLFLSILNEADLTVDSKGNVVSVEERLQDIVSRYSEDALEYLKPLRLAKKLKLVE